jgi:hypothetical protein
MDVGTPVDDGLMRFDKRIDQNFASEKVDRADGYDFTLTIYDSCHFAI